MQNGNFKKSSAFAFAATAALVSMRSFAAVSANSSSSPVQQGQTGGVNNPAETITFEGQGSLNKVIAAAAFSYLNLTGNNGTSSITLDNGPGGAATTYTDTSSSAGAFLNLASQNFSIPDVGVVAGSNTSNPSVAVQTHSALRLEWHWNGTVDGSNDLINDQVGYNQLTGSVSPQQGANRGPTIANPIYVNTNVFNGSGGSSGPLNLATPINGFTVSNSAGLGTYNTYSAANYDLTGNNLLGGTNRVQFSFSDYKTMDYSQSGTPSVYAAPGQAGYGNGNPKLSVASNNLLGIGVNGAREAYQPGAIANMPTTNINPSTVSTTNPGGTAYTAGPWNTAGLDNISSTPVAANAVLIAANPGTGLTRLNKGDSQWLQTTGRLANGLQFNTVSRDADLGQRPTFATATGIDGTWAVGVNDGGDTTTTAAANLQRTIGSMKFSGKSSDTEVNNAIVQSRMAAGVLALTSTIAEKSYQPIRSLSIDFNDQTDPQLSGGGIDASKFIAANLNTISTYQYQAVLLGYVTTIKTPNTAALAAYEAANPGLTDAQAWAQMGSFNPSNLSDPTTTGIKGDATGDVAKFLANMLNSQGSYASATTSNDPADAFLNNSYLLPNLLQNSRDPSTGVITPNPNYDAAGFAKATAIYASKFNSDGASSFGKMTETIGSGSNYGSAVTGGQSPTTFNGNIPITALNADGSTAADGVLAPGGNWLFGNFNQNGVRDLSAVESAVSAAKALWNVEPAGTSGANSAFNVSGGTPNAVNSTPVTYTDVNGVAHTMTKGDLIVMGDYLSVGRFDGASLVALARGAAVSDTSGTGYAAGTLSGGQAAFADALRNGVLRKNTAMDYLQTNTADANYTSQNASAFLRITGKAVLTEPGVTTATAVPANATALNSVDPNSGLELFTYDPAGSNAFNKYDVNRDGVVDFNDAALVDQYNGNDYTNLTQQLAATELTPVTGAVQSISLTYLKLTDGQTVIDSSDLAQVNSNLTGAGSTNWYGYTVTKSGPGTITWTRTGGTVALYSGAAFQLSAGAVHVTSAIDPFTDSSATGTDTSKSLAMTTTTGATLEYTGASTGIQLDRLSTLNISGGQVIIDSSTLSGNRTLLLVGGLNISSGKLDLNNSDLVVQNGNLAQLSTLIKQGYNTGAWNGANGMTSTAAANNPEHLTALGIIQNIQGSSGQLYGSGTALGAFDNINPAATDVLIKYTYFGDTNLDGKVDGSDYSRLDSGFLSSASGWYNGDFNYDGIVNGSDYTLIDNAFNTQGAAISTEVADPTAELATTSAVPEPASGMLVLGLAGLLSRRAARKVTAAV